MILAAIVGVISPSGNEIGPFLSIEQAALSQLVPDARRTQIFAWYNLAGSFAAAVGALCAGIAAQALQNSGWSPLDSYRAVLAGYALIGALLLLAFGCLSPAVEPPHRSSRFLGDGSSYAACGCCGQRRKGACYAATGCGTGSWCMVSS
ncbi:MAG: hypothetical protein U0X20_16440 [Caldilineaceae bacterium]